jgi:hypothetical protein
MRRFVVAMSALALSVVTAGAVDAQITLVPGPTQLVPASPQYIATADFDRDGRQDIAVNDQTTSKVTVLLSGADRQFKNVITFSVGIGPRAIVTGDINGDTFPDIVALAAGTRGYYIYGNGNGTFQTPLPFQIGTTAVDVAIGNFDNQKGNDLAVTNLAINSVIVLLNQGGNKGFGTGIPYPAGKSPRALVTGDLNADGFDDIVVVNSAPIAAGAVSVLMNTTHGTFGAPTSFVVGPGPKSVVLGDFNGDGAPDIAVLNAGITSTLNFFSVSILLNQTQMVNGQRVGTGFFSLQPPVTVTCPSNIGGILIACTPNDLTTGDFNNDGLLDFGVSFFTRPLVPGQAATAGLISAYQGSGDGGFAFATSVPVGLNPQGIIGADLTGDGVDDIGAAEQGSRSVQILRSIAPPKSAVGSFCVADGGCSTGACVDNVCCATPSCPLHEFCNIPGSEGHCSPPNGNGGRCDSAQQCVSGFCVDGFCCGSASCPTGQFCNTGECQLPSPPGAPCASVDAGDQCQTGFCVDRVCCSTATCPLGESCNIPGSEGTCAALNALGVPCTDRAQCDSGNCTDGVCCDSNACPFGQVCNLSGQEGTCASPPSPTVTPTATPTATLTVTVTPSLTPTFTPTPQPNGAPCASGAQCVSGSCADATCCDLPAGMAQCPAGQRCDITGFAGTCTTPVPTAGECRKDSDCQSGNCDQSTVPPSCGAPKTATPDPTATATATATPQGPGGPCGVDADCEVGLLCNSDEFVCCSSRTCPFGESCAVPGSLGSCAVVPTPTPTKLSGAQQCNTPAPGDTNPCEDGLLCNPDNGVCCETENCPDGQRCDIFGFPGQCMDPLPADEACDKNTDCVPPLGCFNGFCEPFPTSTPTLIPTALGTATPAFSVTQTRSGGCSIGDGQDVSGLWLLGGLSLAIWARRRRLVHASRSRGQ